MTNYIFVSLCDNDFDLLSAVEYVFNNMESELDAEQFKYFVIMAIISHQLIRRIHPTLAYSLDSARSLECYLNRAVEVRFLDEIPVVDHDMGSCVINCHTGYVWRV